MELDPLSDALALIRARCSITGGFAAGGDWAMRFRPESALKVDAIVRGQCWVLVDGEQPILLSEGEVVIFNRVGSFVLCSDLSTPVVEATDVFDTGAFAWAQIGAGEEVICMGGHVDMDRGGEELLLSVLPRVTRVSDSSADGAAVFDLVRQLLGEARALRPGAAFARAQYAQLLLVHVLRLLLERGDIAQPGWLNVLGDTALSPALALMHGDPARSWGLDELAQVAAMSRSTFATRFKTAAGQPPVAYLTRWRIRLAERALRETDATVAAVATDVGYGTESSFSHAFQRITGITPGRYRRQVESRPAV